MSTSTQQGLLSGTVHSFHEHGGYGYILPDDRSKNDELFLVHRKSLRDKGSQLKPGDRVVFVPVDIPRGTLATDVRSELLQAETYPELQEYVVGKVANTRYDRGYGFIALDDGRQAFFHVKYLNDPDVLPSVGTRVRGNLFPTEKGFQIKDIITEVKESDGKDGIKDYIVRPDLLAQAILARDRRDYPKAQELYKRGLDETPSVQLVLSYAAMEKNRGRKSEAMDIYDKGILLFQGVAKLREDAGILAASMGQTRRAIELLDGALKLCRTTDQAGEKGVLLALARVYNKIGSKAALKQTVSYYQQASRVSSRRRGDLPSKDLLALNLAKIRLQHYRGELTYDFLRNCGFRIINADLLPQTTTGADLIIEVDNAEISESYGIAGNILVRCIFASSFSQQDLSNLDKAVTSYVDTHLVSDQVVLLILSSLPENLQRALFRRIEERQRLLSAVIPITQESIETASSALSALRAVLDQWLYRRDLFALNFPVVGKRFFGRDRSLAQLRDAILSGTPIGIFGLRKVGKTSLLKETARRAVETGDIVIYVDLLRVPADVADTKWLYWRIANLIHEEVLHRRPFKIRWRLGGKHQDFLELPADYPTATAFDSDLSQLLKAIAAAAITPRPKIVLLLDEIERLLPTRLGKSGFAGFFDFFGYLRGVSQETSDFVVMVTGANATIVETSQFDRRDNPVFNYFQELYLQLLEPEECRVMMKTLGRGMGLLFTNDACDTVYRLTGGHPFFTRGLCSFVSAQYPERPLEVTDERIMDVIDQYLEIAGRDFREIMDRLDRDYPDEREVCLKLAQATEPVPVGRLRSGRRFGALELKHLVGYQIVRIQNGEVMLTMELFKRWLQSRQ